MQTSHFLPSNGLFLKSVKFYKKISRVSVTPTFHLFFMHWSHYPPIWMSPSDYQSFIYFRAVSHKKRVYKSVTCHRFLSSPLLEPVCWVTLVTRVFSFLWRGLSPLSPIDIAKKMEKLGQFMEVRTKNC